MKLKKELFDILIIGILLFSGLLSNAFSNYNSQYKVSNNESSEQELQFNYDNIILNDSIPFSLEPESYSNKIGLDFTKINETRNFVKNGDFNESINNWNALNQTDITYNWRDNGPENSKCATINLTGIASKKLYRPMNESSGIENFNNLDGWFLHNNGTAGNFSQERDASVSYPLFSSDGSLLHQYKGFLNTVGMANSTYQFYYNSSFPILSANLSLYYQCKFLGIPGLNLNTIEMGVFLISPSRMIYLINNWRIFLKDGSAPTDFQNKRFLNIEKYFNETGLYNLTLYSRHYHNETSLNTLMYFDYIELNITWGVKELFNGTTTTWNQNINFDRDVLQNGTLNLSCYITEKFEHINNSKIFLIAIINRIVYNLSSINLIGNNTWNHFSIEVDKSFIKSYLLNVSIGIQFNTSTYIFCNETFSMFFDNVSFIISAHPNPAQIDLEIFVPELHSTFLVNRSGGNQDYALLVSTSFVWNAGTAYNLDLKTNTTLVIVNLVLTIFYYINAESNDDDDEESDKKGININVSALLVFLVLIVVFATVTFLTRFEKRFFMNEKYEYIKKLNIKRKDFEKRDRVKPESKKKKCVKCGRYINISAKFCEHCGTVQ